MSSIKKNVIFNYLGQFYIAFIGILILPLFLKHMGAEAYGLIGFFTLLQGWLQLLDLGMSPTMGREVASLKEQPQSAYQLCSVVRSLEFIFVIIATIIFSMIFFSRGWISQEWLTVNELDIGDVTACIGIVAIIICLRWIASLYRSGINAYEQQVWMNIIDIILATLRSPIALLIVIFSKGNILYYFSYQLLLVFIELLAIANKFYSLLPKINQKLSLVNINELKRIAPFALGIAYTGGIWVITTQLDKLLLSKVLSLAEFGYFSLIATVSAGLSILSGPISRAVLPRMTALLSQGKEAEMLALYRKASRLVVCLVAPVTMVLALFAKEVVYVWTGNIDAAEWVAPVLPLYIIGNGLLAILAFQYYLQYAYGKLKLHVAYNTAYILITIPLIFYAVFNYGVIGAGYVWLGCQICTLLFWMPYVHQVFAPGLHWKWFIKDLIFPSFITFIIIGLFSMILNDRFPCDRLLGIVALASIVVFSILSSLIAGFLRNFILKLGVVSNRIYRLFNVV